MHKILLATKSYSKLYFSKHSDVSILKKGSESQIKTFLDFSNYVMLVVALHLIKFLFFRVISCFYQKGLASKYFSVFACPKRSKI